MRVLYSFPHKFGAGRICYIAAQQVRGLAELGADILVFPGSVHQSVLHPKVRTSPTLARGKLRIPYRVLGMLRACKLHDWVVARRLEKLAGVVDVVHAWPLGALETLKTAKRLGIPTVLERPNTHTRFAFEVVQRESERLGVTLPSGSEHSFDAQVLERELQEYDLADALLCPSDFVRKTFMDEGYSAEKLLRHQYGYDERAFFPRKTNSVSGGLTVLFVGYCAVRKGLHFALEAWLASPASSNGKFLIAGEFLPAYAEKLRGMLAHPSVQVLGQRNDVADLMRNSDVMILPSIEEGFGLVCAEALGSACVPLVSEACTEFCRHMDNSLVHRVGDVKTLAQHISMLHENPALLQRLKNNAISSASAVTWGAAGRRLLDAYTETIDRHGSKKRKLVAV
jgi:glycosyltransferase involved in cell wall biosynthesis